MFFDFPLLYYYINLRSLITPYLFSGNLFFSFLISLSNPVFSVSLSTVCGLLCGACLQIYDILAILLPIKSPIASAGFLNYPFWSSFKRIWSRFWVWSISFCLYLLLNFLIMFLPKMFPMFLPKEKVCNLLQIFSRLN